MRLLFGKHFHGGNSSVVYGGTSSTSDTSVRAKMSNHSGDRDSIRAGIHDPLLYEANNPMSKDRRKFAIICVFDLVLITILWLISAVCDASYVYCLSLFLGHKRKRLASDLLGWDQHFQGRVFRPITVWFVISKKRPTDAYRSKF